MSLQFDKCPPFEHVHKHAQLWGMALVGVCHSKGYRVNHPIHQERYKLFPPIVENCIYVCLLGTPWD